ncbi:hypothetical protein [Rhodoferax fermentans]|uniref:hypothetical protein n=1 Tax=Rhodoferax fermentans TaxID=28066 RepID=UPI001179FCB7|nr:hypothetical protein [Rhodoferax fermentans]
MTPDTQPITTAKRYAIRAMNWTAGAMFFLSGLVPVLQIAAVPREYLVSGVTELKCNAYLQPKFRPWDCAPLPAISDDALPIIAAVFVGLLACAWLVLGSRRLKTSDIAFVSIFFLVLPVFARVQAVMISAAEPAFLYGTLPLVAMVIGILVILIRIGGPAFSRS